MESMIEDLINGNLKDAKKQAEQFSVEVITDYLHRDFGWSLTRSIAAANYLKTGDGWQIYCDCEAIDT